MVYSTPRLFFLPCPDKGPLACNLVGQQPCTCKEKETFGSTAKGFTHPSGTPKTESTHPLPCPGLLSSQGPCLRRPADAIQGIRCIFSLGGALAIGDLRALWPVNESAATCGFSTSLTAYQPAARQEPPVAVLWVAPSGHLTPHSSLCLCLWCVAGGCFVVCFWWLPTPVTHTTYTDTGQAHPPNQPSPTSPAQPAQLQTLPASTLLFNNPRPPHPSSFHFAYPHHIHLQASRFGSNLRFSSLLSLLPTLALRKSSLTPVIRLLVSCFCCLRLLLILKHLFTRLSSSPLLPTS